jgi:hypothetical protein
MLFFESVCFGNLDGFRNIRLIIKHYFVLSGMLGHTLINFHKNTVQSIGISNKKPTFAPP